MTSSESEATLGLPERAAKAPARGARSGTGPRISVITCTWNSEQYLEQSIASVLSQDYDNYEYIFVDGGSTDGTIERIKRVPREIKFVTGIRDGISNAMNVGIQMATGDIIAHMHSDDYYIDSTVFSRVAAAFQRTQARWLFGRNQFETDGVAHDELYRVPAYSYRRLLKGNFIPHESAFVTRALFEEAGLFDTKLKYAMDYDLWLRLGRIAEPVQLQEYFAVFREHQGSTSAADVNRLKAFQEDYRIRMNYAGRSPLARLYHGAHYLVRLQRLKKSLATAS